MFNNNIGAERAKVIDDLMFLRSRLPRQVSIAADFSTAAMELAQFRSLPLGLAAEIFASGLALKVFEDSTNGKAVNTDQERVCKLLIFEPLQKALKDRLVLRHVPKRFDSICCHT